MIQFEEVSLAFSGHSLFQGVSFSLQKGERCGLVGRNGSGKSTLFRLVNGEVEADRGRITVSKNYRIGTLKQHLQFSRDTLLEEAATGLPEAQADHLYKAEKILFGLGFTESDLDRHPRDFSGGFQLRLHLAKVLISDPDCLLLDEPTNYLDLPSIHWLRTFLSRWHGEFILISHDRDFMDSVTTHMIGIHREKVRKLPGSSLDFFQQILLEEEVHEKTRIKGEKKRAHLQSYIDRFGAKASKAAQAQSKKKMLAREPILEALNRLAELSFSFREAPCPSKKMLEAKHLRFSFNQDPLVDDFSLEIARGERVAFIGKNGRGKSTLLRLLGSDLMPQEGSLQFSQHTQIGYFGQTHIDRLNPTHTIEQEISLANPSLNFHEVKTVAGLMMFSGALSAKSISVLSGGEKSRVLLAKIIAQPCNLLLLDEPTHHLDIESIEALIDALEDFSGALVLVTHSELILRRLPLDKIVLCEEGRQTVFLGNYDEFLKAIGWEKESKKASVRETQINEKRERANRVTQRAAALKPIQRDIRDQEAQLALLEKEQERDRKRLELADISPELLKAFGIRQKQIECCESQLYALYERLEEEKKNF